MKRYIPYEVDFDCKVVGDKETIRVQGVMLEHPEGPYVNFSDVERLIAERDAAVKALRQYGQHLPMCRSNILLTSMPPQLQPCDCGLEAAIDAARGENPVDELTRQGQEWGDYKP